MWGHNFSMICEELKKIHLEFQRQNKHRKSVSKNAFANAFASAFFKMTLKV